MNLKNLVSARPITTFISILTAISNVWNLATENAELLGLSSQVIAIGGLVLTAAMMVYNLLYPKTEV